MTGTGQDTSGISYPPPLIFGAGFLAGYALQLVMRLSLPAWPPGPTVGWTLVALGVVLTGSAVVTFRRAGTTPNPTKPATTVVVHGPYRFTRNPMYLGWVMVYLGAVLLTHWIWLLVLLPLVVFLVRTQVIAREEAYLERAFGDAYRAYRARVRRWL